MQSVDEIKQQICDIGRRVYQRGFCAANEGNISVRVNEDEVLCTPSIHCKGFMQPDDICLVDMRGEQLAGKRKRTSEVLMHLTIMKARADVKAVVHCHPPHATAFAVAGEPIPAGLIPEVEIFLGEVPTAPYALPGTPALGESILPFVNKANVVLMANHGTVSYDGDLERAYWWTEILDNYCKMLLHAHQLGRVQFLPEAQAVELVTNKHRWGMHDPRVDEPYSNEDPRQLPLFRDTWEAAGMKPKAFAVNNSAPDPLVTLRQSQLEDLVAAAVEKVVERMKEG
jgi:L-fuculose-phosphate aldolase